MGAAARISPVAVINRRAETTGLVQPSSEGCGESRRDGARAIAKGRTMLKVQMAANLRRQLECGPAKAEAG